MQEYGPNQASVMAFLDRLRRIEIEEARLLASVWHASDSTARGLAWRQVERAAAVAGRRDALARARDAVLAWSRTWQGWFWGAYGLEGVPQGTSDSAAWRAAVAPALDRVAAIVVGDVLATEHADALSGPWLAVVEGTIEPDAGRTGAGSGG
jgi:hypothetical protein